MTRNTILLIFLLSASFVIGLKAQECQVAYYDVAAPPECHTYLDENGEEQEECTAIGSAAFAALLDANTPSFSEPNLRLSEIDFSGTCDCTLKLYSGSNLSGCYVQDDVATTTSEYVPVSDIWTRSANPQSFSVSCNF